jgi:hypothetical protein
MNWARQAALITGEADPNMQAPGIRLCWVTPVSYLDSFW